MSAADKREALEAAVWRELNIVGHGADRPWKSRVADILAAADAYASTVAAETVDGIIREGRARDRRDSLAEATEGQA